MSKIDIVKIDLDKSKYSIKAPYEMKPIGITIHETDNNASARNEIAYMQRNNNKVSFHFAVDEKEIIQGLPLDRNGWHASDGNGTGNRKTIAIEICRNYDRNTGDIPKEYYKARENAERLVGYLLHKYGWTDKDIYTHHYWIGKNCPRRIREQGYLDTFKKNAMNWKSKFSGNSETSVETTKPTPSPSKPSGNRVTVKKSATHFATGQKMDSWVKGYTFDVKEQTSTKTLIANKGSVIGWVKNSDLEGVTQAKPKPKPKPQPKPQTSSGSIKRGDRVKYNGYIYKDSNGNGRGIKVNGTYTATIVNNNKYGVHLDGLGWAEKSKVSNTSTNSKQPAKALKKGCKVTTTATRDIFGTRLDRNTINSNRTFTVEQVGRNGNNNHILLKEVMTWVERSTVKVK